MVMQTHFQETSIVQAYWLRIVANPPYITLTPKMRFITREKQLIYSIQFFYYDAYSQYCFFRNT